MHSHWHTGPLGKEIFINNKKLFGIIGYNQCLNVFNFFCCYQSSAGTHGTARPKVCIFMGIEVDWPNNSFSLCNTTIAAADADAKNNNSWTLGTQKTQVYKNISWLNPSLPMIWVYIWEELNMNLALTESQGKLSASGIRVCCHRIS